MDSNEGDASDPFAHLNERLENSLGHFRKDFELDSNGHLPKERLGPKYGEHGSFLPAYLRDQNALLLNKIVHKIQNPFQQPAMVPKPPIALNGRSTIIRNPSRFSKPQNGPSSTAQNSSDKQFRVPKPPVARNSPNTITRNPSGFSKPQNRPSSTAQNSSHKPVSPVKPSVNSVKPSDKMVKLFKDLVKPSDNYVKEPAKAVRIPSPKPPQRSQISVKPSDKLVKPSVNSVKPSENSVNLSENSVKRSESSVKAVRIASPKPAVETKEKRSLKIRIKMGGNLVKKEESEESSEISRGESKNEELYSKLGLELSPSDDDDDESPDLILKKVTSFPMKGKQILSPPKSKIADLSNKTTVSFSNKMIKPCSKISTPQLKITENGKKVNQENFYTKKERESKAPSQVKVKEELIEGKKMLEFNARASNENGKEKVSDLKYKNGKLGVKPSSKFKVTDKKGQIICPTKEIKKERESYESIVESNGKKAMAEKEATRMAAPVKAVADPAATSADDWVECDECKKWRMLPSSIRPDDLPDKWVCNMITWLGAGMNSCKLTEEETTQALNAVPKTGTKDVVRPAGAVPVNGMKDVVLPAGAVPKTGTKNVLRPAGAVPKTSTKDVVRSAGAVPVTGTKDVVMPAGAVPKTGMKDVLRPAGAVPVTGTKDVLRPAGAVPKTGTKDVLRPAGAVPAIGTKDVLRPAGAVPKAGTKDIVRPAGTVRAELKKADAKQYKDIQGPAQGDLKLNKKRLMEQPVDDVRAFKKLNNKSGNKVPEPATKPENRVPELVKKPENRVPEPIKKQGHKIPELAKKPSKRPNGGEMLGSESSPKKRKMEEERDKPAKEEKPAKTEPADVANRDSKVGPSVQALAAEALDFKHRADRLKHLGGMESESLLLYFHAGLKFLNVASLYEPQNLEGFKAGDANRCIQIYIDTAQIFEYCASEYENVNDKAGASLSYKCIEMALLKAAFFKQPSNMKDFLNLQSALQMLPPGSPRTPASNLENQNNIASMSDNIKSNNLPVALKHLLDYSEDVNRVFETTQRCYEAFEDVNESEKIMIKNCINFAFGNTARFIQVTEKTACSLDR